MGHKNTNFKYFQCSIDIFRQKMGRKKETNEEILSTADEVCEKLKQNEFEWIDAY